MDDVVLSLLPGIGRGDTGRAQRREKEEAESILSRSAQHNIQLAGFGTHALNRSTGIRTIIARVEQDYPDIE